MHKQDKLNIAVALSGHIRLCSFPGLCHSQLLMTQAPVRWLVMAPFKFALSGSGAGTQNQPLPQLLLHFWSSLIIIVFSVYSALNRNITFGANMSLRVSSLLADCLLTLYVYYMCLFVTHVDTDDVISYMKRFRVCNVITLTWRDWHWSVGQTMCSFSAADTALTLRGRFVKEPRKWLRGYVF